jgi:uncharacterized protein (DUF427 family)
MKTPGPEHPIAIEPNPRHVSVRFHGRKIAETSRAMTLREADYPRVEYVPREDADMQFFERTEHSTHCPYKGDASYFTLVVDGERSENAVWSYERPYPPAAPIAGYLAFYADRVSIEES